MAKFPTYEEMAKDVAEKALDGFLFDGRSIREWMQIITSEDTISRKAAIDIVEDMHDLARSDVLSEAVKQLKDLPPVTSQPKMGQWISLGIQGEIDGQIVRAFTCSECGAISIFRMASGNVVNGDLCPNCRANMEEVKK